MRLLGRPQKLWGKHRMTRLFVADVLMDAGNRLGSMRPSGLRETESAECDTAKHVEP